jgi:phosphatidylinositol alpha-1,6-mannosyltransferase
MKRRAIAGALRDGALEGIFVDSWKSVEAIPPTDAPIAVLAHGTELSAGASRARAERIRSAFARARSIIANSRYTAELAGNFIGESSAQIIVVNPPVAPLPAPDAPALAEIDRLIAGRGPVLATLARLEPRKGVDAVLLALAELRKTHRNLVYLIAGDGKDLARLRRLAATLHIEDSAVFLGSVSDPQKRAALLTRADVYAMPSRRVGHSVEGYGIAYVEAGWYGVPALAGNDGGAADAVVDAETGLLCDGGDQRQVLTALTRLVDDEALRKRLGVAAQARVRTALTWSAALFRYLAALGR